MMLVAVALVAASCGARLDDGQLALARRGGAEVGAALSGPGAEASAGGDAEVGAVDSGGPATGLGSGAGVSGGPTAGGPAAGGPGGAAAAAAPCTPDTAGPFETGVTADEIRLGNVSTVSGPVSGLFAGARDGALAFFAYQNSLGGVCGRRLKQVFADDGLDASANKRQHDNLASKVFAMVGSFSVVDDAAAQSLKETGIPDVSEALAYEHQRLPNNFSPQPVGEGAATGPFEYYRDKFGRDNVQRIVFLQQNADVAKQAGDPARRVAERVGWDFVCYRVFEPTDTTFDGDAECAKREKATGILVAGEAGAMGRIAAAFAQQGLSPGPKFPIASYGPNAYDAKFVAAAGRAANGVVMYTPTALYGGEDGETVPEVALFNKWYRQVTNGRTPDLFAAYGWASARLAIQALEQVGVKPTRAALLQALGTIDEFDSNGLFAKSGPASKRPPTCWNLVAIVDGRFQRHPDSPAGFRCDGTFMKL